MRSAALGSFRSMFSRLFRAAYALSMRRLRCVSINSITLDHTDQRKKRGGLGAKRAPPMAVCAEYALIAVRSASSRITLGSRAEGVSRSRKQVEKVGADWAVDCRVDNRWPCEIVRHNLWPMDESLFRWCIDHWKSWGIPTIFGSIAAAGTWVLARRREWKEARRAKADSAIDSQVFRALQNRDLWGAQRPTTGAGDRLVRSAEIAEALSLDWDVVADSLERLEAKGRVRNAGGTLDNPAPYWFALHR